MVDAHHRPEKGETVIGTGCSYKFGGKGGNQAVSAAKSGVGVKFLGAVGALFPLCVGEYFHSAK